GRPAPGRARGRSAREDCGLRCAGVVSLHCVLRGPGMHTTLDLLADRGFCVLRDYDGPPIPDREYLDLEYMDWKSGGDTNFAPLASALGGMGGAGVWGHRKPHQERGGDRKPG